MAGSPFERRADLTGIAIGFFNENYIADEIFPFEKVDKDEYEYDEFPINMLLKPIDDSVGRLSRPNQVVFESTRKDGKCTDHYLESPVPNKDIRNADKHQNPLRIATVGTMELVKLNREIRARDIIFDLNTYLPSLRETLSGASQWSDPTSNPILKIQAAKAKMLKKPTHMVIGENAWLQFQTHPKIVEAFFGTGAQAGIAPKDAVARLLGLKDILVGESFEDTAEHGLPEATEHLWGNHAALIHKNPLARLKTYAGNMTFGMTARSGTPYAGTYNDPTMGPEGGVWVRAGECCEEKVLSPRCGYFFQNVVS